MSQISLEPCSRDTSYSCSSSVGNVDAEFDNEECVFKFSRSKGPAQSMFSARRYE